MSEKPLVDLGNGERVTPHMRWSHTGLHVTPHDARINYCGRTIISACIERGKKVNLDIHFHPDFPRSMTTLVYFVVRDFWECIGCHFDMFDNVKNNVWTFSSPNIDSLIVIDVEPGANIRIVLNRQSYVPVVEAWRATLKYNSLLQSVYNNNGLLLLKAVKGITVVDGHSASKPTSPCPPLPPPSKVDKSDNVMMLQIKLNLVQSELEDSQRSVEGIKVELSNSRNELADMTLKFQEASKALEDTRRDLQKTQEDLQKSQHDLEDARKSLEDAEMNEMYRMLTCPAHA